MKNGRIKRFKALYCIQTNLAIPTTWEIITCCDSSLYVKYKHYKLSLWSVTMLGDYNSKLLEVDVVLPSDYSVSTRKAMVTLLESYVDFSDCAFMDMDFDFDV